MASGSDSDVKLIHIAQSNCDVADREFVSKLISLYKENVILWDANNEHYTNKYRRIIALKKICDGLKKYKPNYTIEELKKKLNILRTNFNKERNKMELRKSMSPDVEPEPILWYYNDLAFLIGQETPAKRAALNNEPRNNEPENRGKLPRSLKRKKISIISETSSGLKKSESEEDLLAKWWAIKLRRLSPDQRLYAEKIINDTLFEAELGNLTRHGATFNATPNVWSQYSTESHSPAYKSPTS